jgi:hypothetical protein
MVRLIASPYTLDALTYVETRLVHDLLPGARVDLVEMSNEEIADDRTAFVQEAWLRLDEGIDLASVGAAVTAELCGHWEHAGACRWPHNNDICMEVSSARFRTLFVSVPGDESVVRERIMRALRGATGVSITGSFSRPVAAAEKALAKRLALGPRQDRNN